MNINRVDYNRNLVLGSRGQIVAPSRGGKRPTGLMGKVTSVSPASTTTSIPTSQPASIVESSLSNAMPSPSINLNKIPTPQTVADVVFYPEVTKDSKSIEIKAVDLPVATQTKPLAVIPVYKPFVPSQPKPISTPMPDILPSKPKDENGMTIDESQAQAVDKVELLNGVVKKTSEKHNFIKSFFKKFAIIVAVFAVVGLIGYYGYINLRIYI